MAQGLKWRDEFQSPLDVLMKRTVFTNGDRVALEYLRLLQKSEPFTDDDVIVAVAKAMPEHALKFSDSPDKPAARERWVGYVRRVEEALASHNPSTVLRIYGDF